MELLEGMGYHWGGYLGGYFGGEKRKKKIRRVGLVIWDFVVLGLMRNGKDVRKGEG